MKGISDYKISDKEPVDLVFSPGNYIETYVMFDGKFRQLRLTFDGKKIDVIWDKNEGLSKEDILTLMIALSDSVSEPLTIQDPKLRSEMFALHKKLKKWLQ